jgi:flagellar protein FlaJ
MAKKEKKPKKTKAEKKREAESHHVFLGIIPYDIVKPLLRPLRGLSSLILKIFPRLPQDLKKTNLDMIPEDYITTGMVSYTFLGVIFGAFMYWIALQNDRAVNHALGLAFAAGLGLVFLFLILLVRMPNVQANTKAEECEKYLLYALKDVTLQLSSGGTLYDALAAVGVSGYGVVSEEFNKIAQKVQVGIPMQDALREMAESTNSEYLKKTAWQMINSLRAGADLRTTLGALIEDLNNGQKTKIMSYARELNLWSLVYMLFAVAIPTIGSTMMVILSTFAGFGVSRNSFLVFIGICFVIQFILVNFVKARRPVVQF